MDADPKWGTVVHGYLARKACEADRRWILHKKICDAVITDQSDDLISMTVQLVVEKELTMLVDINDVKIELTRVAEQYDGGIRRTEVLGKKVAAIHIFDQSRLAVRKHVANPPVSPKQAFDDKSFMNSLLVSW